MQRDVKVGLVLGAVLVAVVAVVFFRRDDESRNKFRELLPPPGTVATSAREMLERSATDPYKVRPEHLLPPWRRAPARRTAQRTALSRKQGRRSERAARPGYDGAQRQPDAIAPPLVTPGQTPPRPSSPVATTQKRPGPARRAIDPQERRFYTIQQNDTLSTIGQRLLGDSSLYDVLYRANQDLLDHPDHLPVGQTIRIPELSDTTAARATHSTIPKTYVVKEDDTLIGIARRLYGEESMFWDIYQANLDQLATPHDLEVGTVLSLPR